MRIVEEPDYKYNVSPIKTLFAVITSASRGSSRGVLDRVKKTKPLYIVRYLYSFFATPLKIVITRGFSALVIISVKLLSSTSTTIAPEE